MRRASVAVMLAVGCGRVGYDLTPVGAGGELPANTKEAGVLSDAAAGGRGSGAGGTRPTDAGSGGAFGGTGGTVSNTGGASTGGAGGVPISDAAIKETGTSGTDSGSKVTDASRCPTPASPISDYCAELPALPAPPVIDGELDCGVALRALSPVAWTGGATPPDATAEYAVAWRPNGVYFFVHVRDPSLVPAEPLAQAWEGDSVELYVDDDGTYAAPPNYDNPGSRQLVVVAPPTATSSLARAEVWAFGNGGAFSEWISPNFRAYGTTDGYVVEAFVTGPDLGLSSLALAASGHVGVDLSVGVSYPASKGPDAGTPGNRVGQYFLRVGALDGGATPLPPFDVRAFCRPTLAP